MGAFIYFAFATLCFTFASAQEGCTAVDLSANFVVGNETVFQWNATLRAGTSQRVTQLLVEKETTKSKDSKKYHLMTDSSARASINGGDLKACGKAKSCEWPATNSTFKIFVPVVIDGNSGEAPVFEAVVDEGAISLAWGPMMEETNKCNQDGEEVNELPNVQIKISQCCSTFTKVKPPPSSVPTCKRFGSRSVIYDHDFSIFATVNSTIVQSMMDLEVTSDFTGPSGSSMTVSANDYYTMCMTQTGTVSSCSFPLVMGDSKYLFILHIQGSDWKYALSAGRLVIRNKELLMEEGHGFTPTDDCFYTSVTFDDNRLGTTELCCKEFA